MEEDREHGEENRGAGGVSSSSLATELDFLAEFAGKRNELISRCMYLSACLLTAPASPFSIGKKRLWVITAPSHNDHYLRMMEKQLEDTEQV